MLRIIKFSDKPCFMTNRRGDSVLQVKFEDGSFSGCLSWGELLKVMKGKAEAAENEKAEPDAEQTTLTSITKSS